jgi:hypothetical protein
MGRSLEAVQREKSTLQRSTDHPAPAAVVPSITSITSPSKTVIAVGVATVFDGGSFAESDGEGVRLRK